ncbi:MAG: methionine synthase [Acidobacteria bacterium]|nr:MAG: methionine synthase [Acidobacteriota bacterium]
MAITTTVVGSYPIPTWLAGNTSRLALRDAVMTVLKAQELAGIDIVSDGELQRFDPGHPETNGMIDYFVSRMDGVRTRVSKADLDSFRADAGLDYRAAPAGIVSGRIGPGILNLPADYALARELTAHPLKFTSTGPHMLAKVLTDRHYGDRAALALDIAEVLRGQLEAIDAAVVQLDEANISGHPEDAPWAADAINRVLDGIRAVKAVHVCFGNYGGQTIQKGFWRDLLPFLNSLRADHLVLEFARRGYGEIEVFRDLDPRIALGAGVVDIKDNEVETPELVASRIETVARALGEGRLRYVHPDCGLWMLQRGVADRKLRALVLGRNLFEGRA